MKEFSAEALVDKSVVLFYTGVYESTSFIGFLDYEAIYDGLSLSAFSHGGVSLEMVLENCWYVTKMTDVVGHSLGRSSIFEDDFHRSMLRYLRADGFIHGRLSPTAGQGCLSFRSTHGFVPTFRSHGFSNKTYRSMKRSGPLDDIAPFLIELVFNPEFCLVFCQMARSFSSWPGSPNILRRDARMRGFQASVLKYSCTLNISGTLS